jgi:hypothetical protein
MMEGLEELGIDDPFNSENVTHACNKTSNNGDACDRAGAARRILILMTDGSPNLPTGTTGYCPSTLPASATWKGTGGSNISYHCAIYYAQQAAKNNVTVYTIGVGAGVNISLLTAMAEGIDPATGDEYIRNAKGKFYLAATPADLDAIFEDILSNVVVRLVG